MNLVLLRKLFTDNSTIGDLSIDGTPFCQTIELSCRKANPLGKLAIAQGRYKVILGPTGIGNRFKPPLPILPLLVGVPGRDGIRIHPANSAKELEGCIAPGVYEDAEPDWVFDSRSHFNTLFSLMQDAISHGEEIWISVTGGGPQA